MADETNPLESGSTQSEHQPDPNSIPTEAQLDGMPIPETSYTHPLLRGKSVEDIQRLYELQERTLREQGNRIREIEEMNRGRPRPESTPAPERDPRDFYADPEERIEKILNRVVSPLREEIAAAKREVRAPAIRDGLKARYPKYGILEPQIEIMLGRLGIQPENADEGQLEAVYHMAYSNALHQGMIKHGDEAPVRETREPTSGRNAPPQHRPSPAPLPKKPEESTKRRELTENERRLMREGGFTNEDEYLDWQELDEEEVTTTRIGMKEDKK